MSGLVNVEKKETRKKSCVCSCKTHGLQLSKPQHDNPMASVRGGPPIGPLVNLYYSGATSTKVQVTQVTKGPDRRRPSSKVQSSSSPNLENFKLSSSFKLHSKVLFLIRNDSFITSSRCITVARLCHVQVMSKDSKLGPNRLPYDWVANSMHGLFAVALLL